MPKFTSLFEDNHITTYLQQCSVTNTLVEDVDVHKPPTPEETKYLINYLRAKGLKPAIVGSVGILKHLGPNVDPRRDFRPTVDLDLWVTKVPEPPKGWRRDMDAPGVHSWISPSGGFVDFLEAGHEFVDGHSVPRKIAYDDKSAESEYPVAHWIEILKLKLSSSRAKDISDCMSLVRAMGKVPSPQELGKLSQDQKENLNLITTWFQYKPKGKYGE